MAITLDSPYIDAPSCFLRGNLHTHTTHSDGSRPSQPVVDDYAVRGYDFLMISDHDKLIDPAEVDARGMVMIPGNEISRGGPHLLHVNAGVYVEADEDRQKVLDRIAADEGAFAVMNHPNWQHHFNHCSQEKLDAWNGYIGIEIYNGVIRRLEGSPLATNRWDLLLASGRRIWGVANDDSHAPQDVELAWNVVLTRERSAEAVLDGLRRGSFYASTGVEITRVSVEGSTLHVATSNAQRLVVLGNVARRMKAVDGPEITYQLPDDDERTTYLRVECWGPGESMAWTQPVFVSR